jgi:VWFA-related protein
MRVLSIAAAAVLAGTGLAQQTMPDSGATFRSSAREVLLEVIVRDAHGRLVNKIDPSQVTVYEDGVSQDIRSFRLVQGREVRQQDEKQMGQTDPAQAAPQGGPASVLFNPLRTINVVCLVLSDLNQETRAFAFDAARKFVNNELRPDTFIGVFGLDSSGLRPVYPFSNNRERLLKAVELAAINQLPAINLSSAAILNGLSISTTGISVSASTNGNADGSSVTNVLGTRGDMDVAEQAGLREIDSLTRMVKQLSPLPFQKTVMLMSSGLIRPKDQLEYWNSLIRLANKGGITFYGLDVNGLRECAEGQDCAQAAASAFLQKSASLSAGQAKAGLGTGPTIGPPGPGQSGGNGPSPAAQMMESMHQTDYLRFGVLSANVQESLRDLAESTGGFLIANTNNTDKLLARVMEDVDTHYELAYRPASVLNDGHFRKVEVKLARADLRIETRGGYFAVPETSDGALTAGDFAGLHALDTKPLPHAFDYGSRAFRFRSENGTCQYAIAFEVPIANLTATAEAADKKHRFHASLLALVKNAQGEIVERVSKDVPSEIPDNYLPALRSETMTYEHAVNLAPGKYTVETAVTDQEGNRASTNILQIENLEQQKGPAISDLALAHRVETLNRPADASDPFEMPGKRVAPFVSNALPAGAKPAVYFVVYPDRENNATPMLRAQFLKDGRVLQNQKSVLPQADASGAVPMAIQPAAEPGDYEVRITVEQGRATAQRSLEYTIAAK